MSLNLRIFVAYFLIVGVAIYFLLTVFMSELKPGMRQSTEETLVDMSNLLAEMVSAEFIASQDDRQHHPQHFAASMKRFLQRVTKAKISSVDKGISQIRVYITDEQGIVRYDSAQQALGQDYSRWNDVYLTLRGQYGVRSTKTDPNNELSTVMHVAAPIKQGQKIVGVLTVAKPNMSVQPFLALARNNIQQRGLWLIGLSLLAALTLSYWLTRSIRKLVRYADKISQGKGCTVPVLKETELAKLALAIDNMRRELEGKDYVEKYVHALTHELKSPVSAIKGASEIINAQMPVDDQRKFIGNIHYEAQRIDEMINRLLALVTVEKQQTIENAHLVDLVLLIKQVIDTKQVQLTQNKISLVKHLPEKLLLHGEPFLLQQAIDNLLQNAIDFSPYNSQICVDLYSGPQLASPINFVISDQGVGIPDYALARIFERFYSLARPASKKKSSGLGLCFVKQIAELHQGSITLENDRGGGVIARLCLNSKNSII